MVAREKRTVKVIGDRNIYLHLSNEAHYDQITKIGKALSSPVRLKILNMLKNTSRSLQEISGILGIPLSSAALHIKTLEDARLIVTESQPGVHGSMRVCTCSIQSFHLETFDADSDSINKTVSVDMPIGQYATCNVSPTCGLADENGPIDAYDTVRAFYSLKRTGAQLIWFHKGFIEYRFPNVCNPLLKLNELSFRMEICSEAPGYQENWPSDITISINDHEIGTYCSPGDYGARRGKLTPPAWPNGSTQYGILKSFSVRETGSYLDGRLINPAVTLADVAPGASPFISLKIEIKDTAHHIGGINIFGAGYGDYPQGIVMDITYQ